MLVAPVFGCPHCAGERCCVPTFWHRALSLSYAGQERGVACGAARSAPGAKTLQRIVNCAQAGSLFTAVSSLSLPGQAPLPGRFIVWNPWIPPGRSRDAGLDILSGLRGPLSWLNAADTGWREAGRGAWLASTRLLASQGLGFYGRASRFESMPAGRLTLALWPAHEGLRDAARQETRFRRAQTRWVRAASPAR